MTVDDGGAAYPVARAPGEWGIRGNGMTLLDHFAGLAMQGLLVANPECPYGDVASFAWMQAAEMIAEKHRPEKDAKP